MEKIDKNLFWTQRALGDFAKINSFNEQLLGNEKSYEVTENIVQKILLLVNPAFDYTTIGSPDEAFSTYKREYRKLIESHYKITYRIGKDKIYIMRIFDTRQNPHKNK